MTCEQAHQAMLGADPAELAGEGASPLAGHLASCAACARRARAILTGARALAAALAARGPRVTVDVALPAARAAAARQRELRARSWRLTAPLALAAGIAALLLWPSRPPTETAVEVLPPELPPFAVQGPPGRTVTVFRTANPAIIVVWYF